jgi:hypothetical protein
MTEHVNRREFLQKSALAGAAATGTAAISAGVGRAVEPPAASPQSSSASCRSLTPKMLLKGTAALSKPSLAASQLSFRIGLARTRTAAYPMNSMDFIMMDLERPEGRTRHAHWCAGDLTGRLLEFLSCAEGVDGKTDPRLGTLFDRIWKQRRPSGMIGRYAPTRPDIAHEKDSLQSGAATRLFCGLVRYYDLTGDVRALEAAHGFAERLWMVRDEWRKVLKSPGDHGFYTWASEGFAQLYPSDKDPRWLEFCGMIGDSLGTCEAPCHAHARMSTLRGLQVAALVSGDLKWNEKPEQNRRLIIEKRFETPDGCTPEAFPHSSRNEGCSIADWLMLNLNAGLILGDDAAYDKAERIFWNALAFNQLITGCFGHRPMAGNGYGVIGMEEAWWCCLHDGGMAMSEYARHTVTFREGALRINFLTPGQFQIPLPSGKWANVKIATDYPTHAQATIEVENLPADVAVKVRVPSCMRKPEVKQVRTGEKVLVTFQGELGHRIEQCHPGVIVTYGPLVLIPASWSGPLASPQAAGDAAAPAGYIPQSMPAGVPTIKLDGRPDANGFVHLPTCPPERPLPDWTYYDEGPGAPTWVEGSAVEVRLKFPSGELRPVRFTPMCYNTSNLSLFETPVVFRDVQ